MTRHPTELLPAAAAGTLDPADVRRVHEHIDGCPPCAEELAEWRQVADATVAATSASVERAVQPPASEEAQGRPDPAGDTPATPFRHVHATNAATYRDVLGAFAAAREQFLVHLRPDDVASELGRPRDDELDAALAQLVTWGNLRATPDTSRVGSVAEFHEKRLLYALSREGEAAERALALYEEVLGRRGALKKVALADVRTGLAALVVLAGEPEPDLDKVALTLRDLVAVFRDLAEHASAFLTDMSRAVDTAGRDLDAYLAYKDRLLEYLQQFIDDLLLSSSEVARLLEQADGLGVDRLLVSVARRELTDEAPGETADDRAEAEGRLVHAWRERWVGLHRWFVGTSDRPAQAELLRRRALAAIPELLRAAQTLQERRRGTSDRVADYLVLARWFAQAPTEADVHRLWRVAFGLSSSRHLTVDTATLAARDAEPVGAQRSWRDAPRVQVSARLRRTASATRKGPTRLADTGDQRAALARFVEQEAEEIAEVRRALAGATRLSELEVDAAAWPVFLRLLGEAVSVADADGRAVTETADGAFRVALEPIEPDDGEHRAAVRSPDGVLSADRDYLLMVCETDPGARRSAG